MWRDCRICIRKSWPPTYIVAQHTDGCINDADVVEINGTFQGRRLKGSVYRNAGEPADTLDEAKNRALTAPLREPL